MLVWLDSRANGYLYCYLTSPSSRVSLGASLTAPSSLSLVNPPPPCLITQRRKVLFFFTYDFKFSVLKGTLDKQYEKVRAVSGPWVSNSLLREVWIGAVQRQSVELCQCKRGELFQPCVQTSLEIYSPSETKELKVHSCFTYLPRLKFSNSYFYHNK